MTVHVEYEDFAAVPAVRDHGDYVGRHRLSSSYRMKTMRHPTRRLPGGVTGTVLLGFYVNTAVQP